MVSKYKSEIAVVSIILSLIAVIVWQFNSYRSLKDERNLYMSNTHALTIGMEQLRKDSTSQAVQIQSLTLTVDEYRKCSENDLKTIEDLKIKLKNVKAVSKQVYKVEAPVIAPVTHETERIDTLYVPYQKVEMHNEYIAFDGVIRNDTLKATVNVPIQSPRYYIRFRSINFFGGPGGARELNRLLFQIIHTLLSNTQII